MADSPLGKYLRLQRTTHNYTQDDLANALSITRGNYSHYENARLIPPTDVLCRIAAFYDAPVDELLKLTLMSLDERDGKDSGKKPVPKLRTSGFEPLLDGFLNECADMKKEDLNQWVTVEDREVLYHYHNLSRSNKDLLLSILRILAIRK